MIATPVSVFQFVSVSAICKGHKLMTKTDGKDRYIAFIQLSDFLDDVGTGLWIPRPVGKHDTVRMGGQNLLRLCMRRVNCYFTAPLIQ